MLYNAEASINILWVLENTLIPLFVGIGSSVIASLILARFLKEENIIKSKFLKALKIACKTIKTEDMQALSYRNLKRRFKKTILSWKDHPDYILKFCIKEDGLDNSILPPEKCFFLSKSYGEFTDQERNYYDIFQSVFKFRYMLNSKPRQTDSSKLPMSGQDMEKNVVNEHEFNEEIRVARGEEYSG